MQGGCVVKSRDQSCVPPLEGRGEERAGMESKGTRLACPNCGKQSYTLVRFGAAVVHCKRCGVDFEGMIRIVRSA